MRCSLCASVVYPLELVVMSDFPALTALILAGGESSRMGQDKAAIHYHDMPQSAWMERLIAPFCNRVFISVKGLSTNPLENVIADDPGLGDIGPIAGLVAAVRKYPDSAWLIVGCDYPYLEHDAIRQLVNGRRNGVDAVAFINPEITKIGDQVAEGWEGCLSIPEIRGRVVRAQHIKVSALDRNGKRFELELKDFPARVVQHETDHLDGVLFFDRMTSFESLTYLEEYSRYHARHADDDDDDE